MSRTYDGAGIASCAIMIIKQKNAVRPGGTAKKENNMRDELQALRAAMKAAGMDAYLIPTADFHGSEYVDDYFKCRAYVSGFTGSAGTLVVLAEEAGLWTDGRYYLQAGEQLAGSGIDLYKAGLPGVPEIPAFLEEKLGESAVLGYDGRVVDAKLGQELEALLAKKQGRVSVERDLVGEIWAERPGLHMRPAYLLDLAYTGKCSQDKQKELRAAMEAAGAEVHILTSPDDIAWLFNMRGSDVENNPVVMAFCLMTAEETRLYVHPESFGAHITKGLEAVGVTLRPYEMIYEDAAQIAAGRKVMLEMGKINDRLRRSIPEGVEICDQMNPTVLQKAVKTPEEVKWARETHVKDGLAVTRFIKWLKENVGAGGLTEISVAEKLEAFRQACPEYRGPSFETIAGYREHGAIIHYGATEETNAALRPEGLLLVDSGGQYMGGTTDVTRTIALGPVTEEERKHYTLAVTAMLRLAAVHFPKGVNGEALDVLARQVFWQHGLDYRHGTGHGVGSFLNVHERPNNIHWRHRAGAPEWAFAPGMITSDEPGYYADGSHGIRIENLILCCEDQKTAYGEFLRFEHLTWVPIDLDALDLQWMTDADLQLLNDYHAGVWAHLEPYMTTEEKEWLLLETRPMVRDAEKYRVNPVAGHFYKPLAVKPEK